MNTGVGMSLVVRAPIINSLSSPRFPKTKYAELRHRHMFVVPGCTRSFRMATPGPEENSAKKPNPLKIEKVI